MQASDVYLRLLAESGNTGFWSWQAATRQLVADATTCRLLQCEGSAVTTLEDLLRRLSATDGAALRHAMEQAITQRGGFQRDILLPLEGRPQSLSLRGHWHAPAAHADGALLCVVETCAIAPPNAMRVQADEAASTERERRLLTIFERAPMAIGLVRVSDGVFVKANPPFLKMFGYCLDEVLGSNAVALKLWHPPEGRQQMLQEFAATGHVRNLVLGYRHQSGRTGRALMSMEAVEIGGEPLLLGMLSDITALEEARQALALSETRFIRMMESNVVGIFIAEPGGAILEANDYFLHMLGLDHGALETGRLNWMELTVPASLDTTLQQIQSMLESGGSLPYEKEYRHADGHRVAALVALSQLSTEPARALVIVLDISALKVAQDALLQTNAQLRERTRQAERAEAAKTLFLSSVSHELRTPLHTVLGHVRLLRKNASGDELQQLSVVEHSSKQLLRLIDDLLEFNHSAIAPEQLLPEVVVLDGFLANLESIGSAAAAESGNRFASQLGRALPSAVVVDEGRLVQVLRILIDNACKYTDAGTVLFTLQVDADAPTLPGRCRLRFAVEDNGCGINSTDAARIFEPLSRGSNTEDRPGLGLGLAIASQWIQRMGTTIALESSPGRGSHFSFVLDLETAFAPVPPGRDLLRNAGMVPPAADGGLPLQALPAPELAALGRLLDMGRLGRLRDWSIALGRLYPEHRNAADRVATLAADADIGALEALHRRWTALAARLTPTHTPRENAMKEKRCLAVAVVDDDAATLQVLCGMLEAMGHQALPFATANSLAAARHARRFDAMVLDLSMPDLDGFELLYKLAEKQPLEPVIISSSQPAAIIQAAGAICQSLGFAVLGILPKPFASDELAFLLNPLAHGWTGQPH